MDRILADYQYYFIIVSYAIFFTFLGGICVYYTVKFRYYTKLTHHIQTRKQSEH